MYVGTVKRSQTLLPLCYMEGCLESRTGTVCRPTLFLCQTTEVCTVQTPNEAPYPSRFNVLFSFSFLFFWRILFFLFLHTVLQVPGVDHHQHHLCTETHHLPAQTNPVNFHPHVHVPCSLPPCPCPCPLPLSLEPSLPTHPPKIRPMTPASNPPSPSALARDAPALARLLYLSLPCVFLPFLPPFFLPPDYPVALHRHSSTTTVAPFDFLSSIHSFFSCLPSLPAPPLLLCSNHSHSLNPHYFFAASSDHPVQSFRACPFTFFTVISPTSSSVPAPAPALSAPDSALSTIRPDLRSASTT